MSDEIDRIIEEALDRAHLNGVRSAVAVFEAYARVGFCPQHCLKEVRRVFDLKPEEELLQ